MPRFSRLLTLVAFMAALAICAGCGDKGAGSPRDKFLPLFGDGSHDTTPVIARVGDIEITDMDLDLYLDELPNAQRDKYKGPDGRRLALKRMVDQAVMALGAIDEELYRDQDVARALISLRRNTLDSAMRNYGLLRGQQPDEEAVRKFFQDNRDKYRELGLVRARDVVTLTKEDADEAYRRLQAGGRGNDFAHVVKDLCVNQDVKDKDGEIGWFNKGGFVPFIRNAKVFSSKAYDLKDGLNPPFKVSDRWHVVEILQRQPERPMTFAEAHDKALQEMLPGYQDAIIKDYLLSARSKYDVQMLGEYAPGKGMTADEIFARAMALKDPQQRIDLFTLIHTDYPRSDRADDALFMAAQVAIEQWEDVRIAGRYLKMLIGEYPDSELIDDATYLRDNLYNPEVIRRLKGGGPVQSQ